jgi:membrane-bound serine protease (ClpP class)
MKCNLWLRSVVLPKPTWQWRAGWCWVVACLLLLVALRPSAAVAAAQPTGPVVVAVVQGPIDLGTAAYLARVLREAEQRGAAAVLIELDTPGGRLDAALQMRDALLATPTRSMVFVNREAFSAGALISFAANEIYLAPGGVLGAATPVDGSGTTADPKTVAAVRSLFRATAELRERDPLLAEAMVDPAVVVAGRVGQGELLALTGAEAQAAGYAEGIAATQQDVLALAGLADAALEEVPSGIAETAARVLTLPAVAALLIALGLLLLLVDLSTVGIGWASAAGLTLIALFFWGHTIAGLAGWEGIGLVAVGLLLLAVEVFVIPGFGVAGVLGGVSLVAGLFLSITGGQLLTRDDLLRAAYTLLGSVLLLALGLTLLIRYLPQWGRLQGLVLRARVGETPGVSRRRRLWLEGPRLEAQATTPGTETSLRGAVGVALSNLRPGGTALIGDQRVEVVSESGFIAAGTRLEVVADDGYHRVVRPYPATDERSTAQGFVAHE